MRELDKIAEDLFDKIRSRFENVSVGDQKAKATSDPAQARFFNFDYMSEAGRNFGNITISLVDENSLKIYFSKNISQELEEEDRNEWFDFLRNLRNFAKRNMLTFDTRDISRSNLKVRDLEQVSKSDGSYKTNELDLAESKLYGNTRSSYQTMGPVKLIVRHSDNIDETVHGARTRNIEAIFVETHLGERFLLPFKKLTPARAMARHISNGGQVHDNIGSCITEMVTEMSDLSVFVRSMRNRTFEDAETSGMVEASVERYNTLHKQLTNMRGPKGYKSFAEAFVPDSTIMEDDYDMAALRERFVKKIFDDRLSEALPYVYRAYRNKQMAMENSYVTEFEDWTNQLSEGTWATPESDEDKDELRKVMEKPIEAGPNGDNASGVLYNLIGSDSLFDEFYDLSNSETGPESDVRPLVVEWLSTHGYTEMATEFETLLQQQSPADGTAPQAGQLTPQANTPAPEMPPAAPPAPPAPQMPTESVDQIRKLAGLRTLRKL
jgi:hypothetical protein